MGEFIKWLISLAGTPLAGLATDILQNQEFAGAYEQWANDQRTRFNTAVMDLQQLRNRVMGTNTTAGQQGGFTVGGQPVSGGVNTASVQTRTGDGEWAQKYPATTPAYPSVPAVSEEQRAAWGEWAGGVPGAWGAMSAPIVTGYGERTATGVTQGEDIVDRALGDYDTAMFMVEGAGAQQRRDIDEAYRVAGAGERARLNELGLGGTTIAPTMAMGYERERLASQGRLEDALLQQRLGVHSGYGANILNTMAGQQAFGAGLSGQALGTQQQLGVGGFNAANQAQMANLGAQGQWAMAPVTYDMAMTGQLIDLYGNVVSPPPNQPGPVYYG
jgi:hypothetical protein